MTKAYGPDIDKSEERKDRMIGRRDLCKVYSHSLYPSRPAGQQGSTEQVVPGCAITVAGLLLT